MCSPDKTQKIHAHQKKKYPFPISGWVLVSPCRWTRQESTYSDNYFSYCIFSSERKPLPRLALCCTCLENVNVAGISVLHEGFRHAETVRTQQVETWPSVHFWISAVNKLQGPDLFWKLIGISKIIITCYPYKPLHMATKPYQTWAAVLLWPSSSCVLLWWFWSLTTQVFFINNRNKQSELQSRHFHNPLWGN